MIRTNGLNVLDLSYDRLRVKETGIADIEAQPRYRVYRSNGLIPPDIPTDNLVFYAPLYRLMGSQFKSRDAYGHLCTVTGAVWTPQGRLMTGDDYIELTAPQLNFTTSAFSIIAWIKITNLTGDNVIFVRGLANLDGYLFYVASTGHIVISTSAGVAQILSYSAAGAVVTNTWYMMGATRSGAVGKVYRNGVDVTATSGTHSNPATSNRTVKIGIYDDKVLSGFIGTMGEVFVYQRALSAPEMLNLTLATNWRYQ